MSHFADWGSRSRRGGPEAKATGFLELPTTVDTRIHDRASVYRPFSLRPQTFKRCPGCGGMVVMPCVCCTPEAYADVPRKKPGPKPRSR